PPPGLGPPAALPSGGRLAARHHKARRRHPGQHRASSTAGSRTRARALEGARQAIVSVFALLAGGGTGGHTYPAIAVAQELRDRGLAVRFVGGERGVAGPVVPPPPFPPPLPP